MSLVISATGRVSARADKTPRTWGRAPRDAILLSGSGNINDCESTDKLAAYVGSVPKVSQSNETDNTGRIPKRGTKLMRTTLGRTLVAIKYSGYLNGFYRRIKERRASGKAIIAAARKLLSILDDTLKNPWVFKDFTQQSS